MVTISPENATRDLLDFFFGNGSLELKLHYYHYP
jgi:hypothetical protein